MRKDRRTFFRGWVALTIIGLLLILAIAAYAVTGESIQKAAGILTMAVMALLLVSALVWLVQYIIRSNRRHR